MDSKAITKALNQKFDNAHYLVNNVYFFGGSYCETDLLVVQKSGLIFDIEIKISRSDFFADFKKSEKHSLLSGSKTQEYLPNKFYYAVPKDLVSVNEVPYYAGLIYVDDFNSLEVKKAPFLHKNKLEFRKRLSDKFYYSYRELISYKEKDNVSEFKKQISELQNQLSKSRKSEREIYLELIKIKRQKKDEQ